MTGFGKILVIAGIILILVGLILWLGSDKLNWFGKLPGDIRLDKGNIKIFFPLTSMVLISLLLSLMFWIIRRFLH